MYYHVLLIDWHANQLSRKGPGEEHMCGQLVFSLYSFGIDSPCVLWLLYRILLRVFFVAVLLGRMKHCFDSLQLCSVALSDGLLSLANRRAIHYYDNNKK